VRTARVGATRMAESNISVSIVHRDDVRCPAGPRDMMGEAHRVGCSNGRTCPSERANGGTPRAVWYAKHSRISGGGRQARAMYFCQRCGAAFAHRFGLELSTPS